MEELEVQSHLTWTSLRWNYSKFNVKIRGGIKVSHLGSDLSVTNVPSV